MSPRHLWPHFRHVVLKVTPREAHRPHCRTPAAHSVSHSRATWPGRTLRILATSTMRSMTGCGSLSGNGSSNGSLIGFGFMGRL